ncbi:MAG: hypothetical protein AB1644_02865 [Candidatus Zixiibacteriota bacterium]
MLDLRIDLGELGSDFGGFGGGSTPGAPETVGDLADKMLLKRRFRFEFPGDIGQQAIVFGLILGDLWGGDDDGIRVVAVFDGVPAGDGFPFVGFGAGGFVGVAPIGAGLFLTGRHSNSLIYQWGGNRNLPGFSGESGGTSIDGVTGQV